MNTSNMYTVATKAQWTLTSVSTWVTTIEDSACEPESINRRNRDDTAVKLTNQSLIWVAWQWGRKIGVYSRACTILPRHSAIEDYYR